MSVHEDFLFWAYLEKNGFKSKLSEYIYIWQKNLAVLNFIM